VYCRVTSTVGVLSSDIGSRFIPGTSWQGSLKRIRKP
jgi:hypothetical protein